MATVGGPCVMEKPRDLSLDGLMCRSFYLYAQHTWCYEGERSSRRSVGTSVNERQGGCRIVGFKGCEPKYRL